MTVEQSRTETSVYIVAIPRVLFPYILIYPILNMKTILILSYPSLLFLFLKKYLIYELLIFLIIKLFVQRESGVVMIFNQQVAKVQQERSSN